MTKVDCLKRLCEKITGHKSNGDTVCEVLHDMGKNYHTDYRDGLIDTGEIWLDGKKIYKLAVIANLEDLADEINKYHPDTIVDFYGQALSNWGNLHPIPSAIAVAQQYKMDLMQDNVTQELKIQYGEYFTDIARAYAIVKLTIKEEE